MKCLRSIILAALCLLPTLSAARAGLLGSNITIDYNYLVPGWSTDIVTVTAGVEISCLGGGSGNANLCAALIAPNQYLDIGDTSIGYSYIGTNNSGFNPVSPNGFTFRDLNLGGPIVAVGLSTDIAGFSTSRISFTDTSVTVELGGLAMGTSAYFTLDITAVPEPIGAAMLVGAVGGLLVLRRRPREA